MKNYTDRHGNVVDNSQIADDAHMKTQQRQQETVQNLHRYFQLQALRKTSALMPQEKDELIEMCTKMLDQVLHEHKQIFIRLKHR
jgi:regulator of sigma D